MTMLRQASAARVLRVATLPNVQTHPRAKNMFKPLSTILCLLGCLLLVGSHSTPVHAQGFGIELLNTAMPVSGGMAGTSIARPLDITSAINGNPAALRQHHGTKFSFSGTWIEPTFNVANAGNHPLFGVTPFPQNKSEAQGVAAGNIGWSRELGELGLPATLGVALVAGAGAGSDFRHVPESNGTYASILALDIISSAAVDVTDRLSAGASIILSNTTLAGPFVGTTGASYDYGLRGSLGVTYDVMPETTVGFYWKTKVGYTFNNLVDFGGGFQDVSLDRPETFGFGLADSSLMNGKLLLAIDATYLVYSETSLLRAFYEDQWGIQLGAQYSCTDRLRLRLGYAGAENAMRDIVPGSGGGVAPPGGAEHIQYVQSLFPPFNEHRISGGIGVRHVLPGVHFDMNAGGMFEDSQTFGDTTTSLASYWVGGGLTFEFCRGSMR